MISLVIFITGTMGLASSIGLGLALAQSAKVIAIDGDGSILTNLRRCQQSPIILPIILFCQSLIMAAMDRPVTNQHIQGVLLSKVVILRLENGGMQRQRHASRSKGSA